MAEDNNGGGNGNAKIPFGGLWKNKSRAGETYLSGKFGLGVRLLVFPNKNKEAGDNKPDYHMVLVEEQRKENTAAEAPAAEAFNDPFAD